MKNKTKVKAGWEIEFDKEFVKYNGKDIEPSFNDYYGDVQSVKNFIKKNFVAKGEVRERVNKYIEKNDFRIMRKLTLGSLEQLYEGENTEENFINGLLKSLE